MCIHIYWRSKMKYVHQLFSDAITTFPYTVVHPFLLLLDTRMKYSFNLVVGLTFSFNFSFLPFEIAATK